MHAHFTDSNRMTNTPRSEFLAFGRPSFGDDEIEAVTAVLRSGWIGMGRETIAFEEELAAHVGARHVVTVNSCTSALFLSLLSLGVGPGDEVICPSLTWCSTANAAVYLGARPVFCDVDPRTLSLTPGTVLPHVVPRTRAVVAVHMGGRAAPIDALREALPAHVAIVEDAAHAIGTRYASGAPVGSSGNLTCFSFYANKNLSTGEGGAIALGDGTIAERLRSLRQHGLAADAWKRYIQPQTAVGLQMSEVGYKMNYTDLQAAIGRVQLRRQGAFAAHRHALASRYAARLADAPVPIQLQEGALDPAHARHLLVATLPIEHMALSRNELLLALRRRNIGASVHYPPLHAMPAYQAQGCASLPHTEWLAGRIMTLPISASMTLQDADEVTDTFIDLLSDTARHKVAS